MMVAAMLLFASAPQPIGCAVPPTWSNIAPSRDTQRPFNVVRVEHGRLTWNHTPITEERLQAFLEVTLQLPWPPILIVDPGTMGCAMIARVAQIARRVGLPCGNGKCVVASWPPAPPHRR